MSYHHGMDDDIADALLSGGDIETGANRAILRGAVMRQIFSPYSGKLLDVREAVLLDGSDYQRADGSGRGKMDIMTAEEFDYVIEKFGGLEALVAKLGYQVDVYDGRKLFGGEKS